MNDEKIVVLIVFIILIVLTIILLTGKGAMLIAGYNTASDIQKREYDPEKLSKSTGKVFVVLDIILLPQLVLYFLDIENRYINLFIVIASVAVIAIYIIWVNVTKSVKSKRLR